MEKCKKCGGEFTPQKGLKKYCSLSCRNSRTWSEDDKMKKSLSGKNSEKVKKSIQDRKNNKELTKNIWKKISETKKRNERIKLLHSDFNTLKFDRLKKRVLIEQDYKCNRCGLSEWLGEEISLELEHIDGDNSNNDRNNLEVLCPNCHSLTKTWRGRNKRKIKKVSDEQLTSILIKNELNIRQSLIEVGLSPKGGNYKRCHKLLRDINSVYSFIG